MGKARWVPSRQDGLCRVSPMTTGRAKSRGRYPAMARAATGIETRSARPATAAANSPHSRTLQNRLDTRPAVLPSRAHWWTLGELYATMQAIAHCSGPPAARPAASSRSPHPHAAQHADPGIFHPFHVHAAETPAAWRAPRGPVRSGWTSRLAMSSRDRRWWVMRSGDCRSRAVTVSSGSRHGETYHDQAGIMEISDICAINKSTSPRPTRRARAPPERPGPLVKTVATESECIDEGW